MTQPPPVHTPTSTTSQATAPEPTPTSADEMPTGHATTEEPRSTQPSTAEADRLRAGLADYIRGRGTFRTPAVENAFRTVPRHLFLPGADLTEAYAPRPVITKRATSGAALSSASSPNLVADMLNLRRRAGPPGPGDRRRDRHQRCPAR